jgi:hypothetical protein
MNNLDGNLGVVDRLHKLRGLSARNAFPMSPHIWIVRYPAAHITYSVVHHHTELCEPDIRYMQ